MSTSFFPVAASPPTKIPERNRLLQPTIQTSRWGWFLQLASWVSRFRATPSTPSNVVAECRSSPLLIRTNSEENGASVSCPHLAAD
ncbi:hypothetical protein MLD38_016161 [Melastoma candidum]|uniref:Uncharacterized protein n=1 Tax=Melastoma candidum TaxID=119954 RepID=A0ACB9RHU6_9MYRT|nr:hypothetical protein MLD38_016161 [Melastoma candidum]